MYLSRTPSLPIGQTVISEVDQPLGKFTVHGKRTGFPGMVYLTVYHLNNVRYPILSEPLANASLDGNALPTVNGEIEFVFDQEFQSLQLLEGVEYGFMLTFPNASNGNTFDIALGDYTGYPQGRLFAEAESYNNSGLWFKQYSVGNVTFYRIFSEIFGISDSISRGFAKLRNDAFALADTFSRIATAQRSLVDSVVVSETITRIKDFIRATFDSVSVADSIAKRPTKLRSETVTLTDTLSRLRFYARSYVETVTLTDTLTRSGRGCSRRLNTSQLRTR
jgi:hypothetical protein